MRRAEGIQLASRSVQQPRAASVLSLKYFTPRGRVCASCTDIDPTFVRVPLYFLLSFGAGLRASRGGAGDAALPRLQARYDVAGDVLPSTEGSITPPSGGRCFRLSHRHHGCEEWVSPSSPPPAEDDRHECYLQLRNPQAHRSEVHLRWEDLGSRIQTEYSYAIYLTARRHEPCSTPAGCQPSPPVGCLETCLDQSSFKCYFSSNQLQLCARKRWRGGGEEEIESAASLCYEKILPLLFSIQKSKKAGNRGRSVPVCLNGLFSRCRACGARTPRRRLRRRRRRQCTHRWAARDSRGCRSIALRRRTTWRWRTSNALRSIDCAVRGTVRYFYPFPRPELGGRSGHPCAAWGGTCHAPCFFVNLAVGPLRRGQPPS